MQISPALLLSSLLLSTVLSVAEAAQIVNNASASNFSAPNESLLLQPIYRINSPQTENETGLGLRIHFNSQQLTFVGIQNLYANGVQPIGAVQVDSSNYDNDSTTDRYITIGWVDFAGQWPGTSQTPLSLLQAEFRPSANFTQSTRIRLTAAATSNAASFTTQPTEICAKPYASVTATDDRAFELNGDTATLHFSLDRILPSLCGNITLDYQIEPQSSASSSDYTPALIGTVTIPAGTQSKDVIIAPVNDTEIEPVEQIAILLKDGSNYLVDSNHLQSSVYLISDDQPVRLNGDMTSLPIDGSGEPTVGSPTIDTLSSTKATNPSTLPTPVPTVQGWLLIILSFLFSLIAYFTTFRRTGV